LLLVVYAFLLAFPRFGLNVPVFWKLVVPMILVSSASTAEVFRAGINAVDRGQYEAAASLGMVPRLGMRLVVLPQAFRLVLPGLLTQLVSLLKDSTLGYVVSYPELMQQGKTLTSYTGYLIQTYLVVALIYVVLNLLLTRLAHWLQGRTGRRASAGHSRDADQAADQASGLMPAAQ
jgi:glutamate transport system permease protein